MAPTEGRVARPERRWGYRRGTPMQCQSSDAKRGQTFEADDNFSEAINQKSPAYLINP